MHDFVWLEGRELDLLVPDSANLGLILLQAAQVR